MFWDQSLAILGYYREQSFDNSDNYVRQTALVDVVL